MKRRRIIELAVVLIALAILVPWMDTSEVPNPDASPSQRDTAVESTHRETITPPPGRLAVDGVWLGMTKQQLLLKLGKPSRILPSNDDYEQWDYYTPKRITIMLDAGDKVVTVDGASLTRDGESLISQGMPLTSVEPVLGKSREDLATISNSVNAGFSTGGQLVHLEHREKEVTGRVHMTVDYSVVKPPQKTVVKEPPPEPEGIILEQPWPLHRQ